MPSKLVNLKGGLDLSLNLLERQAGSAREAINFYESTTGGYRNVKGFERYDGRPLASTGSYILAKVEQWDKRSPLVVGDSVTLFDDAYPVLGIFEDSVLNTAAVILYGKLDDTLDPVLPAVFTGTASLTSLLPQGAETDEKHAEYLALAQNYLRSKIQPVPGSGPVRGVASVDGTSVAFRDSADGNTLKCFKSTETGWQEVNYAQLVVANKLENFAEGDYLNGTSYRLLSAYPYYNDEGTRVEEKRVYAVLKEDGAAPELSTAITLTHEASSTSLGAIQELVSFTWKPGGRVQSELHNFFASSVTRYLYFTDGVNPAGVYKPRFNCIQPIAANLRANEEKYVHLISHNERLWLSTPYGTLLNSVVNEPEQLDGLFGGAEWGVGDEITGLAETNAASLFVFTRSSTHVVKGTGLDNWQREVISSKSGAYPYGQMGLEDVYAFNQQGITSLARTQTNGGFAAAAVSDKISELLKAYRVDSLTAAALLKELGQIRFFFKNRFLMLTRVMYNVNGKEGVRFGITEGYYPFALTCVDSGEKSSGPYKVLAGSEEGYVYQLESGTSADGLPMLYSLVLNDNHLGDPQRKKKYRRLSLMSTSDGEIGLTFTQTNNNGSKPYGSKAITLKGAGSAFDVGQWDKAVFDAVPDARASVDLTGSGYSLGLAFYLESAFAPEFTLHGYTLTFTNRGLSRR